VKVIVGLGNPGREYAQTRHNVGWWVVDHLADVWRFEGWKRDGEALVVTGFVKDRKVKLIKPQTFMNLSGEAVRQYARRPFWSATNDMLVVADEVAFPIGRYRFREKGSAGGHNGLKSIENHLHTQEYGRLRIGVAPAEPERKVGVLRDFVLGDFGKHERDTIIDLYPTFVEAIELWIVEGMKATMNRFPGKEPPKG